jgi:hypothetical protein
MQLVSDIDWLLLNKRDGHTGATTCDCHWKSIKRWVGSKNVVCCSRYKTHTLLRNLLERYLTCKEEPVTLQTRYLLLSAIRLSDLQIQHRDRTPLSATMDALIKSCVLKPNDSSSMPSWYHNCFFSKLITDNYSSIVLIRAVRSFQNNFTYTPTLKYDKLL